MRSDSQTVNGLSAYKLGTSQTGTAGSVKIMDLIPVTTIYLGIRVWIRSASGSETEVTSGSAVAIAYSSGTALISATWSCPSKTLASTDCIVIRVYAGSSSPPTNLEAVFVTEQLGAQSLDSATWTVYYYLYRTAQGGGNYAYYYRWDTSTYNSRITSFTWTGSPKSWHNVVSWASQALTRQWISTASFQSSLITKTWTDISSWSFYLFCSGWHNINVWTIETLTRAWQTTSVWNSILTVLGWHNINTWTIQFLTSTWQTISAWNNILPVSGWHSWPFSTGLIAVSQEGFPLPIIIGAVFILALAIIWFYDK